MIIIAYDCLPLMIQYYSPNNDATGSMPTPLFSQDWLFSVLLQDVKGNWHWYQKVNSKTRKMG